MSFNETEFKHAVKGSLFELRSRRKDEAKLPMKTFSAIKPRDPEADPTARRRSSLVAHEEAAFEVKVTAWQQKINAEDGTDHEVNLGKIRKTSVAAEDVVKRPKSAGNRIKRPLSSYGVIFALPLPGNQANIFPLMVTEWTPRMDSWSPHNLDMLTQTDVA